MKIVYLILGIVLAILGAIICLVTPAGALAIVFGVILIVLSRKQKPKAATPAAPDPDPQPVAKPVMPAAAPAPRAASPATAKKAPAEPFENFYLENVNEGLIRRVADLSDGYKASKRELVDLGYADESIYKYETITAPAVLEEKDGGLAVMYEDEILGTVKAGSVSHVRNLLADPRLDRADVMVFGGPHKYIAEDEDDDGREVYEVTNYTDAPFKVTLRIYTKPEE